MGMFDSFYDARGNEWQTKAFGRSLARWDIGDLIPGAMPLEHQVEVLGSDGINGEFEDGYATIRDCRLVSVPADRVPELPLLRYGGLWAEPEPQDLGS